MFYVPNSLRAHVSLMPSSFSFMSNSFSFPLPSFQVGSVLSVDAANDRTNANAECVCERAVRRRPSKSTVAVLHREGRRRLRESCGQFTQSRASLIGRLYSPPHYDSFGSRLPRLPLLSPHARSLPAHVCAAVAVVVLSNGDEKTERESERGRRHNLQPRKPISSRDEYVTDCAHAP